ncbi:MAG: translation factor Sua5, partial [Alphaproteobacteria bacterium]|nr:translation factor Sua5 [Alphaproteobacteria bacterium]
PFPIAAPSANMSGSISPTTAQHVVDSLGDLISVVLEGGPCKKGIESTIIDMSEAQPTLLRSGSIPSEAIEEVFGLLLLTASKSSANPKSPGLLSRHYAPGLPMRLEVAVATDSEAFLGFGPDSAVSADLNLSPSGDLAEAAANLFAMLRQLDNPRNFKGIAVAPIPERGVGKAINDRLRRGSVRYSKNASQE